MATNNALNNIVNGFPIVNKNEIPSAVYIPILTAISNSNSYSNIRSLYYAVGTTAGNVCVISTKFTVVPTAISFVAGISIPVGANFAGAGSANLIGGIIFDTGTNAILGSILDSDSASGDSVRVQFAVSPSALSVSNTVNVSIGYIIQ